jgi:hypothetical protein
MSPFQKWGARGLLAAASVTVGLDFVLPSWLTGPIDEALMLGYVAAMRLLLGVRKR